MRILFLGDIVGQPGVMMIRRALPAVIRQERLDVVIANAENVTSGSGLTPRSYRELRLAGIDVVTMGDHVYKRLEIVPTLEKDDRICRPANYPAAAPGRDVVLAHLGDGTTLAVFCLQGRTFMRSADCPFAAADRVLQAIPAEVRCILVDMHAEATADKYLMLHHLRGRVSAVLGTHTHVQTADEHILDGTAFICDVGMTGPHESILGRRIDRVLSTTISFLPSSFEVARGDPRLSGAIVEIDPATGRAQSIRRYTLDETGLSALKPEGPG
jgi:metallophosphoesterase (TIGR00282 family)